MEIQDPINQLIGELSRLPGIGTRTATRLAYYIMNQPEELAHSLADALVRVKDAVNLCEVCCNLTEEKVCGICRSSRRDQHVICVVQSPTDLRAIEDTGDYRGVYHVLHGLIRPLEGKGPNDIEVASLLRRLGSLKEGEEGAHEIILAVSPSVEGEATALYLTRLIKPMGIVVSRIASGVPIGGELEYVDRVTIARALSNRSVL